MTREEADLIVAAAAAGRFELFDRLWEPHRSDPEWARTLPDEDAERVLSAGEYVRTVRDME